jgi:hypothetical protein
VDIEAHLQEPWKNILEQRLFATEQMGAAGDVEEQAIPPSSATSGV